MFKRVFIFICFSLFVIGSVFSQERAFAFSFSLDESGEFQSIPGPRPSNEVVVVGEDENKVPTFDQFKFFGNFDVTTGNLSLYWDNCDEVYGFRFNLVDSFESYIVPVQTPDGTEHIDVVLKLDTEILLPDGNYHIRLLKNKDEPYEEIVLGFNKDTL